MFTVKITKYLRFIIDAEIKLRINLKKLRVIKNKKFTKLLNKYKTFWNLLTFKKN